MEEIRGNLIGMHYENIFDLIDSKNGAKNKTNINFINKICTRSANGWCGPTINKYDDAIEYSMSGDHELYKTVRERVIEIRKYIGEYSDDYKQNVQVIKRRRVKKNFGDELDIHAVNQGRLDKAWSTTERIEFDQEHHLVTIFIDIGGSAMVDAIDTLWIAAACIKFVEDLEAAGKSVQVIIGTYVKCITTDNKYDMVVSATAKRYNERMSVERLSSMTHIGFYRTAIFVGKLCCSKSLNDGLGRVVQIGGDSLPHHIQDEVKEGHTKIVIFDKATDLKSAINSLNSAYAQMKEIKS